MLNAWRRANKNRLVRLLNLLISSITIDIIKNHLINLGGKLVHAKKLNQYLSLPWGLGKWLLILSWGKISLSRDMNRANNRMYFVLNLLWMANYQDSFCWRTKKNYKTLFPWVPRCLMRWGTTWRTIVSIRRTTSCSRHCSDLNWKNACNSSEEE